MRIFKHKTWTFKTQERDDKGNQMQATFAIQKFPGDTVIHLSNTMNVCDAIGTFDLGWRSEDTIADWVHRGIWVEVTPDRLANGSSAVDRLAWIIDNEANICKRNGAFHISWVDYSGERPQLRKFQAATAYEVIDQAMRA